VWIEERVSCIKKKGGFKIGFHAVKRIRVPPLQIKFMFIPYGFDVAIRDYGGQVGFTGRCGNVSISCG